MLSSGIYLTDGMKPHRHEDDVASIAERGEIRLQLKTVLADRCEMLGEGGVSARESGEKRVRADVGVGVLVHRDYLVVLE